MRLRMKRIRKQARYVYDNSEFYRKKFQEAGAQPEDIKTWDDFRRLPIMLTPQELKEGQKESLRKYGHPFGLYLCAPIEKVIGIQATSGTTGEPTFYALTEHDIRVNDEAICRAFWRAGMRPGDAVMHGFGLSMWVAGIPFIRAVQRLGARPIPAGAEAGTERFLRLIQLTRPRFLLLTPSFAEYLIEKTQELLGCHAKDLGIERIICAGEPGGGIPSVRKKIEEGWNASLFDYAGGIWGISSISCDHHEYQGMHLVSEDFIVQHDLVDPDTLEPIEVKHGAIGAVVSTAYKWEAAPPFKFLNNDVMQILTETCPCGVPGYRRKIIGRRDDLLIVKGVNVYPSAVQNIVNTFVPEVTGQMRLVVNGKPPRVTPPIVLRLEHGKETKQEDLEHLRRIIQGKIADVLRFTPEMEFVEPESLSRSRLKTKLVEVRDQV